MEMFWYIGSKCSAQLLIHTQILIVHYELAAQKENQGSVNFTIKVQSINIALSIRSIKRTLNRELKLLKRWSSNWARQSSLLPFSENAFFTSQKSEKKYAHRHMFPCSIHIYNFINIYVKMRCTEKKTNT